MSFIERLRGQGKLHREGEFSLDLEQAGSKLSRFQFQDDQDFLYHLVGGLFRLGAQDLEVEWKANRLCIGMQKLPLEPDFLPDLPAALLEENSPQRRLAAAAQSLLVHKLIRFDWLGSETEQVFDYLSGKGQNWQQIKLREIQLEGLPSGLVDRALAELSKRAVYCRKPLLINGRALLPARPSTLLAGLPAICQCRPGQTSQLELVVDEMVCPPKPIQSPFPWHGVCYGSFRLDVSLSKVVEDELYAEAIAAIESTYPACIENTTDREVLGKLLTVPAEAWLEPLLPKLKQMPLFTDQRGRKWSLQSLTPPLYYASHRAPVDLPETILIESSTLMLECLQAHFGEQFRQAGEVVLRQLRRQLNRHEWSQRPQTGLALPPRHWLSQKSHEQSVGHWVLGIPDDWAEPGGEVTLLHQGRKICTRKLPHSEVAFTLLCEIEESQIHELWDDASDAAWRELEPRWLHSLEEQIREMAGERAPEGAVRTYLVEHLSRSQRPQESYFSKTLLFRDWHGQLYSLYQLLALPSDQVLCLVDEHQEPLDDFVPSGVFLRASNWEARLLRKINNLKLFELSYLLADLQEARSEFCERSHLLPEFGQGAVHLCVRGVQLEAVKVDSVLAFETWARADDVKFQIRLENSALGRGRFRLIIDHKARRLLDGFIQAARELPVPLPLDNVWREWAREATMRNLPRPELACWQTLGHGPVSLQRLQTLARVHWTSGPGSSDFNQELLLVQLSPARQKHLESQCQNEWVCLDAWFAEQERLRTFLKGPTWAPDFRYQAEGNGVWLVGDRSPGKVIFLLQGRKLREEEGLIPCGLRATCECQGFEDSGDRQQLHYRVRALLLQWLSLPRPREMLAHWREWEDWDPELAEHLRRQPWFQTSQGNFSWEDLMEKPELFRVVALHPGLDRERLYLAESGCPPGLLDSLMARHGKAHSVAQTDRLLQEEKRLAAQRQRLADQNRRLSRLKHTVKLEWGEVGLSGQAAKDCWLLLPERSVLIHNVPPGLLGTLQCSEYRLRRIGGQEYAELGQALRRRFYEGLLPLWQERIGAGRLNAHELNSFCECLMLGTEKVGSWRWIPCADGSLTSLAQLKIERQESGELGYWPKTYAFCSGGERITPILSSTLLLEVVGRYCGCRPTLLPKPLLHQDVKMPSFSNLGQVLRSLGEAADRLREQVVTLETRRASLFETLFPKKPTPAAPPARPEDNSGRALLTALRRQAGQLTQGAARREVLAVLEKAQIGECKGLWDFSPGLVLSRSSLSRYLGEQEPPIAVTLSLLLSLVSAINTRSEPFTDEMESKFLGSLTAELVGSWATSGNAGSGEVSRS